MSKPLQDREILASLVSQMIAETGFQSDAHKEAIYWTFALMAVAEDDVFASVSDGFLKEIEQHDPSNSDLFRRLVVQLRAARQVSLLPDGTWAYRRERMALFLDAREITGTQEREEAMWRITANLFAGPIAALEAENVAHPERLDPSFPRRYAEKHPGIRENEGFLEVRDSIVRFHQEKPLFIEYLQLKHPQLYVQHSWVLRAVQEADRLYYGLEPAKSSDDSADEMAGMRARSHKMVRLIEERDVELAALERRGVRIDSDDYARVKNMYDARIARLTEDEE